MKTAETVAAISRFPNSLNTKRAVDGDEWCDDKYPTALRVAAKPVSDTPNEAFGWLVGILFPIPNGCLVYAQLLRHITLEQKLRARLIQQIH